MNKQKHSPIWTFLALLVLALFLIFVVYPLVLILYKSVINPSDGSFTLENFTRFFTRKYYTNTLINSFKVTIVATLISATLGLLMAYITRQYQIAGSKWLNICIVVSYLSPPFIGAYAWIQLLGRNGVITRFINGLFGVTFEGIYGFAGIVLVFSLQSFPLVYMYVCGALQNLDNSLNEAAESLGASNFQRVTGIILPLVLPTVLASSLLVFMRVFADFGTPMLIGEGYRTYPVVLYNQFMGEVSNDNYFAAALCVITEENGNVSVRKAPWNETEVISDKPQVIRGRMIFSGGENGRGDWVDFKPYVQGKREKPFTEILKTKHGVVRTSKRTVQVNYAFSKDMSKAEILRCLKGEHQEMVKAIKPFKENVEWEDYKE